MWTASAQRLLGFVPQRPPERRAQIVVIGLEPAGRDDRPSRRALGIGRPGELEVEGVMARLHGRRLIRLDEKLARVLAHRLEQAIPVAVAVVLGHHQRLVDKPPQEIGDLALVHALARRDLLDGLQREGPGKHAQPAKQRALDASSAARGSNSASP